jgi:hypothetical protein
MLGRIAVFAVLLLVAGTSAHALTLSTPSVSATNVDNFLDCRIVNLADKPITVLFEMVDNEGAVLLDESVEVPPGGIRAIDLANTAAAVYCRFTGKFKKKAVRASVAVMDAFTRTISIAPAQ